mmetsp:Transcript_68290/g.172760  ORF Transcript_68290/g.172760 Transcript_68290/m.172760 type:complete len:213 (+) Transcript_68290:14-652(+)
MILCTTPCLETAPHAQPNCPQNISGDALPTPTKFGRTPAQRRRRSWSLSSRSSRPARPPPPRGLVAPHLKQELFEAKTLAPQSGHSQSPARTSPPPPPPPKDRLQPPPSPPARPRERLRSRPLPPPPPPPPLTETLAARSLPFRSSYSIAKLTLSPSNTLPSPSRSADTWQKTSSPPSDGWMKPKPLSLFHLFIVPLGIVFTRGWWLADAQN